MTTLGYKIRCDRCGATEIAPADQPIRNIFEVVRLETEEPSYGEHWCKYCVESFKKWRRKGSNSAK